jgi:hypothetical protein
MARSPLDDYADQAASLYQRGLEVGTELASRWGDRSLADGDWTADVVMTELIESWERLTPLAGESLELWLQLVQRSWPGGRGTR